MNIIVKIIKKIKSLANVKLNKLDGVNYWKYRAKKYKERSVLNINYRSKDYAKITENQKTEIYPILKKVLTGKEKIALDIGCGNGRFTHDIAQMINGKTYGIDPVQELIDIAPKYNDVEYKLMNKGVIPFEDNSVDLIWICLVLGGIKGEILKKTILEINRVLKDDGLLFLIENTHKDNTSSKHWEIRNVNDYIKMFDFIKLERFHDYRDLNNNTSILTGRKI